ncbi:MAG: PilZ domain-containing protein [Nannocystaceae bacterium]|nr:PilZ domain-containing protein [bacterium]
MVSGNNPAAEGPERRTHARVLHTARAVLSTGRGEFVGDVVDLSVGGLAVNLAANVRPGEFVRVRLPLQPGDDTQWIDPDAVVVRVAEGPGYRTVGLSFHGLACGLREQLAEHVEVALQEQAPLPQTPTQRFTARPRGDLDVERQALRDAVVGQSSDPARGASVASWIARVFGRRAQRQTPAPAERPPPPEKTKATTAAKAPEEQTKARHGREELQGLIRASLEHVAQGGTQGEGRKTKKR